MVSSPFGGVDFFNRDLWFKVCEQLAMHFSRRRVLDVGCGRGLCEPVLREQGADYAGIDLVASESSDRLPRKFCLAQADRLPFPDGSFDSVICFDAFEHFPDPALAAGEFSRVLRPGGFVFLSAPNYRNVCGLVKWWEERFGRYDRNTWAPFGSWAAQAQEQFMTPGRIERWFASGGLRTTGKVGLDAEIVSGLFPWYELHSMPERIRLHLQRRGNAIKRFLARQTPTLSLHIFWKFER